MEKTTENLHPLMNNYNRQMKQITGPNYPSNSIYSGQDFDSSSDFDSDSYGLSSDSSSSSCCTAKMSQIDEQQICSITKINGHTISLVSVALNPLLPTLNRKKPSLCLKRDKSYMKGYFQKRSTIQVRRPKPFDSINNLIRLSTVKSKDDKSILN